MKQMRLGALVLTVTLALLVPADAHAAVTLYPLRVIQPSGSKVIFTPYSKPYLRLSGKRAVWYPHMHAYNPGTHVALFCRGWLMVKDRITGQTKKVTNTNYVWTKGDDIWFENLDLRKPNPPTAIL